MKNSNINLNYEKFKTYKHEQDQFDVAINNDLSTLNTDYQKTKKIVDIFLNQCIAQDIYGQLCFETI